MPGDKPLNLPNFATCVPAPKKVRTVCLLSRKLDEVILMLSLKKY